MERVRLIHGDAASIIATLPDDSIDLLFTSPPYEDARTYGIDFNVAGQQWVDWMVGIVKAASPKVRGLIAINCEGRTRNYSYSCVPFLLIADLHRAGFNLRKPCVFSRVGIPGSGGPDWLRNDWEPIVCVTRSGKLPWSDNTAMGHPPKWAPGGEMSHRLSDGTKRNQCGRNATSTDRRERTMVKEGASGGPLLTKKMYSRNPDCTRDEDEHYAPPAVANPGNVIHCQVGGGVMGHDLAHENEAPFPLKLAEFFVRSFCPPDGVVLDPFCGSGTVGHAAVEHRRRFIGIDVRESQIDLTRRRLESGITPELWG